MLLSPGDRFDRYTIESIIGEGGMGIVYKALDSRLHRRVALKLVRLDASDDPNASADAASRLMREARAAAALDHPNAVSVFDVAEVDGTLYIAMELISGRTLRTYVGDDTIPESTKLRWLVDAARALAAAHSRGLVHRDVKPENVMVRTDGVVKVLDFGIAKRFAIDAAATGTSTTASITQTGNAAILGTPRYLSPEQVRGEAVDGRADQFSWGVVAYELLTGKLPWNEGTTGINLLLSILQSPPAPPTTHAPDLPMLVEATILKTLAKSPADRFASMDFVVSALETFVTVSRRSLATVEAIGTRRTEPAPPLVPATTPTPREGSSRSKRAIAVTVALAVVAAAGVAIDRKFFRTPLAPATPTASAPASARAAGGPTAIVDMEPPHTTNPEALAAFRAYQASFRDGVFESARMALERAVRLDPAFSAAYLRLAYMDSNVSSEEGEVRKTFKKAMQYRSTLTPRDQMLLDAFEPYFQREPPDPKEAEARLIDATTRYPDDAELAYFLGSIRYNHGDLPKALEAFDRAIAIDPKFAHAWGAKGGCLAYLGNLSMAKPAFEQCLEISGSATECLWYRAQIDEQEGDCADEEATARRWVQKDPDDYLAYQWLAKALFAEHKPVETVRAALEQKWARLAPERRARLELLDRVRLEIATGDFASAEKHTLEVESLLAGESGALAHAESHSLLVQIHLETGRDADARKVADAFLKRRDAWIAPQRVDDRAMWEDAVPLMLGVLLHTGAITRADFEAKHAEWLASWRSKTTGVYVNYLWIYGFALPAETKSEAAWALAAQKEFMPQPLFTPQSIAPAHAGKVLFAAERFGDAIAPLRQASRSCIALYEPIEHVRATARLGAALEQFANERPAACEAYANVIARWGGAKPRSITLERVKKRAAALGCAASSPR